MRAHRITALSVLIMITIGISATAHIAEYPPYKFAEGPYPRFNMKHLATSKEISLYVDAYSKVKVTSENNGKQLMIDIHDGTLEVYHYGETIWGVPPFIDVYGGDLDANGFQDIVIIYQSRQMGLPLEGAETIILMKAGPNEYRYIGFPSVFPGPEDFVDINQDGKCEVIMPGFYFGEKHNYFTYSIYEITDSKLQRADDRYAKFPKYVWFSFEPNDADTTKLLKSIMEKNIENQQDKITYKSVLK